MRQIPMDQHKSRFAQVSGRCYPRHDLRERYRKGSLRPKKTRLSRGAVVRYQGAGSLKVPVRRFLPLKACRAGGEVPSAVRDWFATEIRRLPTGGCKPYAWYPVHRTVRHPESTQKRVFHHCDETTVIKWNFIQDLQRFKDSSTTIRRAAA